MNFNISESANQFIAKQGNVAIYLKREDLLHPVVSGNKFRKLKYNLVYAKANSYKSILTFGGAYSNHIAAVAAAGKEYGLQTIGIIRGEELADSYGDNSTLQFAKQCGMHLEFVSRSAYRKKRDVSYLQDLNQQFPNSYIIPEGGANALAIKGCEEILNTNDEDFDMICCSAGTGGTVAGLINSAKNHQKILAFSALKGDFLKQEIQQWVTSNNSWELISDYHFGGYAKYNFELIQFINEFKKRYHIQLDPIYTAKMFYGIFDMINRNLFHRKTRILAVHTGGLQGITGINQKLQQQGLPLITHE